MSSRGILLTVLVLALIGLGLYSLEPARPSLGGKKRKPESTKSSSSRPRSGGKKASSGVAGTEAQGSRSSRQSKSGQDEDDAKTAIEKVVQYHLPYAANVGYVVRKPESESSAILFDLPSGTPVTAIRAGTILGVSGPTPRPGEDLVFGRQLPRNAILIQHTDTTFALYQNVDATIDTGTVVTDRVPIATARANASLKVSVSRLDADYTWYFSSKGQPDGAYLKPGEAYLRADSDVDHPTNAIARTYTTDAGNFAKKTFRRGESVRLHSRFNFPVRGDTRFAVRPHRSQRLTYHDARLDVGRKAAHGDLHPDDLSTDTSFVAYLYFDDQPMDSTRFSIPQSSP